MEKFENFSHDHYLTLDQKARKEGDQMTCYGCTNKISSDFYGCTHCKHYICKSCFGLPPEMLHPFHKEHPLTLLAKSPYKEASASPYCHACRVKCEGFIFHCSECKFDLDVNCATLLMPTTNNNKASEQQTHPHPLIPCYRKYKQVEFLCCVCKQSINGTIYVCLSCRAIMDESCSQLPQQITHHIHPRHTLTLTNYGVKYFKRCIACGVSKNRFCYTCSGCSEWRGCKFHLDVRCASLISKPILENQLQVEVVVQAPAAFTHPHDLIPCDSKGFFNFSCSACQLSIDGTVYVCHQCNYLLHKSCAELPRKINHPFHPQHPLVLIDYKTRSHFQCQACKCSVLGFRYSCDNCEFEIDVTCASLTNSPLKFQVHQHPLAYFNENSSRFVTFTKKEKDNSVTCSTCKFFTGFPFFRCVPCDFSIKLCCLSILPHTWKHSNHRHSLILTYSHIKDNSDDDDDSEYYCDVCEELRKLQEPTYYCKDCHYVAHISCVFHEILPLLEGESGWRTRGEEIIKLQAKEYALIMKIEILTTMLYKLKENREFHFREYQIGLTEAETRNASTDQKTFSGAVSDHPVIIKLDEEIVILQADLDALTEKLEKLTTKLHKLKGRYPQHVGYEIGSIPSLGTKSSVTILDEFDEVVEEDCSVESAEKDEDEDEESHGTFSTLAELDEGIETIQTLLDTLPAMLEALPAMLEALLEKRARISGLELK